MLQLMGKGTINLDYNNNIRTKAKEYEASTANRKPLTRLQFKSSCNPCPLPINPLFRFLWLLAHLHRSTVLRGQRPFQLDGNQWCHADIAVTDALIMNMFLNITATIHWMKMVQEKIAFQGLPARICWLGQGEREKAGLAFNELVRSGKVKTLIIINRDHIDTGSVDSHKR